MADKLRDNKEFDMLRLKALQTWQDICKLKKEHEDIRSSLRSLKQRDSDVCRKISDNEGLFNELSKKAFGIEQG